MNLERYKIAVSMMHEQVRMVWQMFAVFVAAHAIVAAQVLKQILEHGFKGSVAIAVSAILGIVGCFTWSVIFERGYGYFLLRCEQVRASEPFNYRLFRDQGERFAKGESVYVNPARAPLVLPKHGRGLTTKAAASLTIWVFGLGYFLLILGVCSTGFRGLLCNGVCVEAKTSGEKTPYSSK